MKVIFICGSLEPGRDGVGDYTRRLAGELIKQGHQAAAMAVYDNHITRTIEDAQEVDGVCLPALRVTASWSAKKRFSLAKKWIENFDPEWISLQFVPFSFHPKGLSFNLGEHLKTLSERRNCHVMFHELWVGMNIEAPIKLVLWGWAQRWLIRSLLATIKPDVIHTQSQLYHAQLMMLGWKVKHLPLFSNIPITKDHIIHSRAGINDSSNESRITFVIFGAIHRESSLTQFAREVALYSKKNAANASVNIIGRSGPGHQHCVSIFKQEGITVKVLGEQPPEIISRVLSEATIGISTTPFLLVEKSGAVASMRERGLPVICISGPWRPRIKIHLPLPAGIIEYKNGNFVEIMNMKNIINSNIKVAEVANLFVDSLQEKFLKSKNLSLNL